MGVSDLAPMVNQNQGPTQCMLQWLAQLALPYLKQALVARTELPTYAKLATHDNHSVKNMTTSSCALVTSSESCHVNVR